MSLSATELGDGPAVVLLHGQPGSGGDWDPVALLLRSRARVIAPDRPGYGRSGGRAVGFRENAAAVVDLLDARETGPAVLVGHSWGTGVALAAAIGFPERVRALVLASPLAPGIPPGPVDRLLARPRLGAAVACAGFKLAGLGLAVPPVRSLSRAKVPTLGDEQVAVTAAAWRGSAWRSFHAEQRSLVAELPSLAAGLPAVEVPATILYGTRDRIAPPPHARQLAGALPRARLLPAEGAGHMLPQQRPQLLAEAIAGLAAPG